MQNTRLDPLNIQYKCSVIIKKPKYYLNDGWSWIISSIESGKLNENSTNDDIFKLKTELVNKNKKRLNQFLRKDNNKNGVLIDPCSYCIDVPYYIIGDKLDKLNIEDRNYIDNNLNIINDRLMSCSIQQDISGDGSCSFSLNNTDDIYTLNNEISSTNYGDYILDQANICVIEPNDEVEVYLSDWDGKLNLAFVGLVTNVNLSDDGLNKTINVQCNNMKKKLTWHYYNAQAGFDIKESRGLPPIVWSEQYMSMTLNEAVSYILAETYCDIYKRDDFLLKLVQLYSKIYTNSKLGVKANNKQNIELLKQMNVLISDELKEYISIHYACEFKNGKVQQIKNKEEGRVGFKCTIDYDTLMKMNPKNEDYVRTPFLDYKEGEEIFKIEGINQIAWTNTLANGTYDFLFSNYKRNDEVISSIAQVVQYEFFATENGVIRFRPSNFILPYVLNINENISKLIENNYWITEDKEKYIISQTSTKDDSNIFTRVNVSGKFANFGITHDFMRKAGYAPQEYLNKYGLRMMPSVSKSGLVDDKSLLSYGQLLLTKNNINYELSNMTMIMNSNLRVGNPIFINKQLAVWYIGRVSHNFSAGGICTTELTLTYKRTPLCLQKDLDKYLQENTTYGNLSEVDAQYIKDNKELLTWGRLVLSKEDENKDDNNLIWKPIIYRLYDIFPQLIQSETNFVNDEEKSNKKTTLVANIKNKNNVTFEDFNVILSQKEIDNKITTMKNIRREMKTLKIQHVYALSDQEYNTFINAIGTAIVKKTYKIFKYTVKGIGNIIYSIPTRDIL